MEEQQIFDIWETFKDYIPEKSRDTAASQYVEFLLGQDIDEDTLENLKGYDDHLDQAIDLVLEENNSEDEFQEEENWDEDVDDEDY